MSTERLAACARRAVVGARFVSTESGAAGASRAVVGARTVSTERLAACARRAVVGARFVSTESGAAGASRAVVASSHWPTPLPQSPLVQMKAGCALASTSRSSRPKLLSKYVGAASGGISLLFSVWGGLATCSHVFPLLANLCV